MIADLIANQIAHLIWSRGYVEADTSQEEFVTAMHGAIRYVLRQQVPTLMEYDDARRENAELRDRLYELLLLPDGENARARARIALGHHDPSTPE